MCEITSLETSLLCLLGRVRQRALGGNPLFARLLGRADFRRLGGVSVVASAVLTSLLGANSLASLAFGFLSQATSSPSLPTCHPLSRRLLDPQDIVVRTQGGGTEPLKQQLHVRCRLQLPLRPRRMGRRVSWLCCAPLPLLQKGRSGRPL